MSSRKHRFSSPSISCRNSPGKFRASRLFFRRIRTCNPSSDRSQLRGHESHGVARMPRYVEWVQKGTLIPNQKIRLIQENEVLSIPMGSGFGQSIGEQTIRQGVEKALKQGFITALRNSGHLGRISDWAELARNPKLPHFTWSMYGGACWLLLSGSRPTGQHLPFCCGIPRPDEPRSFSILPPRW